MRSIFLVIVSMTVTPMISSASEVDGFYRDFRGRLVSKMNEAYDVMYPIINGVRVPPLKLQQRQQHSPSLDAPHDDYIYADSRVERAAVALATLQQVIQDLDQRYQQSHQVQQQPQPNGE